MTRRSLTAGESYYVDPAMVPRAHRRSTRNEGLVGSWVVFKEQKRFPFDSLQRYASVLVRGYLPCVIPIDWLSREHCCHHKVGLVIEFDVDPFGPDGRSATEVVRISRCSTCGARP